jgi:hypothetical protein
MASMNKIEITIDYKAKAQLDLYLVATKELEVAIIELGSALGRSIEQMRKLQDAIIEAKNERLQ